MLQKNIHYNLWIIENMPLKFIIGEGVNRAWEIPSVRHMAASQQAMSAFWKSRGSLSIEG